MENNKLFILLFSLFFIMTGGIGVIILKAIGEVNLSIEKVGNDYQRLVNDYDTELQQLLASDRE